MIRLRAAAMLSLFVIAAGCTSGPSKPGVIQGTGSPCIGPVIPDVAHLVASVRLVGSNGKVHIQRVRKPYHFRFVVRPGHYVLSEPGVRPIRLIVHGGEHVSRHLAAACL